jgi:hypothetical protein
VRQPTPFNAPRPRASASVGARNESAAGTRKQ